MIITSLLVYSPVLPLSDLSLHSELSEVNQQVLMTVVGGVPSGIFRVKGTHAQAIYHANMTYLENFRLSLKFLENALESKI